MKLYGISSMATRLLLADIAALYLQKTGTEVQVESIGGADAAKRVGAGEAFDMIALASDAIDALIEGGHIVAGSRANFVRSKVALAVRTGTAYPRIDNEDSLRETVLAAPTIGYSTGPSGTAVLRLFARWGLTDALADRLVLAPPGVPVGRLLVERRVALGFQQLSELIDLPDVDVVGTLPSACEIVTTFSAGVGAHAAHPQQTRQLIEFLRSDATAELKRRHGLEAA